MTGYQTLDLQALVNAASSDLGARGGKRSGGPLPSQLVLLEDALPPAVCRAWVDYADGLAGGQALAHDRADGDRGAYHDRHSAERITEWLPLGGIAEDVITLFAILFHHRLAMIYDVRFEWFETPQLLRYRPGGLYHRHSDSERFDSKQRRWVRSLDRDYSVLVYLNEDFQGGALSFTNHRIRIQPGTGTIIAFPSDHRYLHAAEELISGRRYALVSWAAACGSPRVHARPPATALYL